MQITRKDVGYTIYSRLEESLRAWVGAGLLNFFGKDWPSHIPQGIWKKIQDKSPLMSSRETEDPMIFLDETDIPDIMEIACQRSISTRFIPDHVISIDDFRQVLGAIYDIRCKIAHVKRTFSAIDLDLLIESATRLLPLLGSGVSDLKTVHECIRTNPDEVVIQIPPNFFIYEDQPCFRHTTNLPPGDYDPDGGFIGRKEDLARVIQLLLGELHRVITISGAGGVGKTALAHQACYSLLSKNVLPFDAIVWVSAKEERLTVTGIEPIEPSLRNYEGMLDSILGTFGWTEHLSAASEHKEENVNLILRA